jgi:hypothetical protein
VYYFFADMVRVATEQFAPHLGQLVPQMCALIAEADHEVRFVEEDGPSGVDRLVEDVDDEDDDESPDKEVDLTRAGAGDEEDDDEEYIDGEPVWDVHTALVDVKKVGGSSATGHGDDSLSDRKRVPISGHRLLHSCAVRVAVRLRCGFASLVVNQAAVYCLGELAQYTGAHFAPFLQMAMEHLVHQATSFNHVIRMEVASVLPQMVNVAVAASPLLAPWQRGNFEDVLTPPTRSLSTQVLEVLRVLVQDDDEQDVAAVAFDALETVLTTLGPSILAPASELEKFMLLPLQVLREGLPCQQSAGDDDEGEEVDDEDKHDLMESASDFTSTCAKVLGEAFIPFFDQMFQPLVDFTHPPRPESQRAMAMGCFAEVCKELGPPSGRYFEALLPLVKRGMADGSTSVRRNSAYAMGLLFELGGAAMQPHVMEV